MHRWFLLVFPTRQRDRVIVPSHPLLGKRSYLFLPSRKSSSSNETCIGKGKLDPSPELLLIQLFRFSMVAHCPWGMVKGFRGENSPFQLATAESVEDGLGGIAPSMPQLQETFHVWACILAQILQNFLRSPLALPGSAFHKALELDRAMFAREVN